MSRSCSCIPKPVRPTVSAICQKKTIALQGNPQVLSGHVVTAVPLLFQARSLVGETFRESLHNRSYLDTVEVWGSSPHVPTIFFFSLAVITSFPSTCFHPGSTMIHS